jgi:hypothetical protein
MKSEIKTEINKLLDEVPEDILQDILHLLQDIHNNPADKIKLSHHLRQILTEDKELLERLAK